MMTSGIKWSKIVDKNSRNKRRKSRDSYRKKIKLKSSKEDFKKGMKKSYGKKIRGKRTQYLKPEPSHLHLNKLSKENENYQ